MNTNGFTLIEVMIVLSLIIATALLCYSSFSWIDSLLLRFQLEQFCATCSYLQQRARIEKRDITLCIDEQNSTYTYEHTTHTLPRNITFGYIDGVKGPPGSPNSLITKSCTFAQNAITFYQTGVVSSGTLYVVNQSGKTLYAMSNAVSHLSYIRLYRYDGAWKLV